ncbi:hypothetical protein CFP56_019113 [Quercus suber]|uniref:Uncharacterized protein n=1 Tax=Quercus suber TaxID=58331 RepID=A0AAW0M353_QUESU
MIVKNGGTPETSIRPPPTHMPSCTLPYITWVEDFDDSLGDTRGPKVALGCQLPGKEDGDSSSTKAESQSLKSYLMGTSFSKLHPKIQQNTRLAIRTLLPEIQQNILTHKAITSSYDRWMYLFKVLVSTAFIRTEDMTGDAWLSLKAIWYESFGDADRVYERTRDRYDPYPGLLINIDTEDPVLEHTSSLGH